MNIKENSISGVITAVFVFLLPFVVFKGLLFSAINTKYFFIYVLVYILLALFAYKITTTKHPLYLRKRWLLYVLLGAFSAYLIASFAGVNVVRSLKSDVIRSTGLIFLGHIGLLIFLLSELLKKQDWLLMRRVFVVSSVIFSFMYFFGTEGLGFSAKFLGMFDTSVAGFTFGNTTFAAAYILFGIVFALIELSYSRIWSKKFWGWSFAILIQFLSPLFINFQLLSGEVGFTSVVAHPSLVLGSARSSSVTAILIIIYFLIRYLLRKVFKDPHTKKIVSRVYSALWLLAIVTILTMLFIPGTLVREAYVQESTAARPTAWSIGTQGISDRPVVGWGPENYNFVLQKHFDNRLYLSENQREVWFDKAHNVFIDTLVDVGVLGLIALITLLGLLLFVFIRAAKRGNISGNEAHLLGVLLVGHLLQLQTSFEVVPTYFAMALVLGYGLWLERKQKEAENSSYLALPSNIKTFVGGVLVLLCVMGSVNFLFIDFARQKSILKAIKETDFTNRVSLLNKALKRSHDTKVLRFGSSSLILSVVENLDILMANKNAIEAIKKESSIYEESYLAYVDKHPDDYRARMNLAHLLFFESALGEDKIERGREVLSYGYDLSPNNPLTYTLEAMSYVYQGNFTKADEIIQQGIDLNPDITFTREVEEYIQTQKRSYPSIKFLRFENL